MFNNVNLFRKTTLSDEKYNIYIYIYPFLFVFQIDET